VSARVAAIRDDEPEQQGEAEEDPGDGRRYRERQCELVRPLPVGGEVLEDNSVQCSHEHEQVAEHQGHQYAAALRERSPGPAPDRVAYLEGRTDSCGPGQLEIWCKAVSSGVL
jgi:hypothetical protein